MSAADTAAVLFDLGGVLFDYQPDRRWESYAQLADISPTEVKKRLSSSGYSRACEQGRLRGTKAYAEGIRLLDKRLSMERFIEVWVSAFSPNHAVLRLAIEVKKETAVAVLSNNSDLVRMGLEARWPDQLAPFMPRIFSADLGLCKPDPRAFSQVATLLGEPVERLLLIDDAPVNTNAAAALGFQTHHYTDHRALRQLLSQRGLL